MLEYREVSGRNPGFLSLCRRLDCFLNQVAGGEQNRSQYLPYNAVDELFYTVLASEGGEPVGCAGLKLYDVSTAEVKRVFVEEAFRGRGIGRELMRRLEETARKAGLARLVLESGEPLVASMHLYRSIGFRVIPNYGPYIDMAASVCMEKLLNSGDGSAYK